MPWSMRELLRIIEGSGWRKMRSCHGAEQKVNNLERSDCENIAEEETDELHRELITNESRHIAEQIQSDSALPAREFLLNRKVKSTVMDGIKIGKFGRSLVKEQNLKSVVTGGPTFGKLENYEK